MLRTHWELDENTLTTTKIHTLTLPKNNIGPLSACYLTSLAGRFFWLLVFFVTFWPMLMAGGWSMGICLYVWNPWQTWGQVSYPYIKICQKNSSSILCTVNLKSKLQQAVNMTIYPGQFVSKVPHLFPLCAIFSWIVILIKIIYYIYIISGFFFFFSIFSCRSKSGDICKRI
jgi:hypothetical protein